MEFQALADLATSLAAERSVQRVLQTAVDGLCSDSSMALARVWLLGPGDLCEACAMRKGCPDQTACLHLEASDGRSLNPNEPRWRRTDGRYRRMPLRDEGFGRVASYGEPLLIQSAEEQRKMILDKGWASRENIAAFAGLPLTFRGEIFGMLGIFSRAPIGDDELSVFRTFANQAAVAIANARAFEEVERLRLRLEEENRTLREEVVATRGPERLLGESPPMQRLAQQIRIAAQSHPTVLIQGESGTGKELIARAIHEQGARRARPFVTVNCAAVPRELFESEFFGHVKGSYTGAIADRLGRFALADGGTLFLDEVGEIPLELQPKLLRVIQEGAFERVGEATPQRVDVHLIAATNRNLDIDVEAGRFRADLFYRLNVFPIVVPPLRDRLSDLPELADHFLKEACRRYALPERTVSDTDLEALAAHPWPGNVRELQNVIARAVLLAGDGPLRIRDSLTPVGATPLRELAAPGTSAPETYDDLRYIERETVRRALESVNFRVSGKGAAAERLGIKPTTLAYRMRILGIERPRR